MSKYNALWEYIQKNGSPSFKLTFEEIQEIAGIPIDHSFLNYKKELTGYGYHILCFFKGQVRKPAGNAGDRKTVCTVLPGRMGIDA